MAKFTLLVGLQGWRLGGDALCCAHWPRGAAPAHPAGASDTWDSGCTGVLIGTGYSKQPGASAGQVGRPLHEIPFLFPLLPPRSPVLCTTCRPCPQQPWRLRRGAGLSAALESAPHRGSDAGVPWLRLTSLARSLKKREGQRVLFG